MEPEKPDMSLADFDPVPTLVTEEHRPTRPPLPAVDAHNHAWGPPAAEYVAVMDRVRVERTVILDGAPGAEFTKLRDAWAGDLRDRFYLFTNIAWKRVNEPDFARFMPDLIEEAARLGADGLKVPKGLGLGVRDAEGRLYPVDHERFDPIWERCGELGLPVTIHTADPVAFFQPLDGRNERWDELHAHPHWHFHGGDYPAFGDLIAQLGRLIRNHPETIFIGAHVGAYAENVPYVASELAACPNYYVDLSERIPELGRQPYTARSFLIEHADRVLWGTDRTPRELHVYETWRRLLETRDEYFAYSPDHPPRQGRWRVYGLGLPEEALERIYRVNAANLFGEPGRLSES